MDFPDLLTDVTTAPASAKRLTTRDPTNPDPPSTTIFFGEDASAFSVADARMMVLADF
jgi:hypothetical protein